MLLTPWLKLFAASLTSILLGRRRTPATWSLPSVRVAPRLVPSLSFERLEDRTLLAMFTVTNLTNSGAGSLRQAIIDANNNAGPDDIVFQPGLSGPILMTGGEMDITQSLTITGNGSDETIIDGQLLSRIFDKSGSDVDLTLDSLTLRNGRTTAANERGGAIDSRHRDGSITVRNSTLTGNSTLGDFANGGAIFAFYDDVTISNSYFRGNFTSGRAGDGGAIYVNRYGSLTVTDSTFVGNRAQGEYSTGGAIGTFRGTVTIVDSTLRLNSSTRHGGAVWAYEFSGDVTIVGSTLSGNSTTDNLARGGAIYTRYKSINITNSTISGNYTAGRFSAGAAIATDSGDVTVTNSTIVGNEGRNGFNNGGGIFIEESYATLTIQNSIVAGNTDTLERPEFSTPGTVAVAHSLIGDNTGTGLTATGTASPDANGNFIGTGASPIDPMLGPLALAGGKTRVHTLRPGSLALDAGSNGLAVDPGNGNSPLLTDQRGGPFGRISNGTVDMGAFEAHPLPVSSLIVSTAVDEDDGDFSAGDLSLREAIILANANLGPDTITFSPNLNGTPILLEMGEIQIADETRFTGNGAARTIVDAQHASRVFKILGDETDVVLDSLTLQNGRTAGNIAKGGAVRLDGFGTLLVTASRITGSSTAGTNAEGGAISAVYGEVILVDSQLSGNSTSGLSGEGGAVFSRYGSVTVRNSTLNDNYTTGETSEGGAITVFHGDINIVNSTLSGNRVDGPSSFGGGAIFTDTGDVSIVNSTLTGNSAAVGGGVVKYQSADPSVGGDSLTIHNSIVAGNIGTGPDIDNPNSATIAVFHSLIGDNDGTNLSEAQTPDSNGNLIGDSSQSGAIDPLLGPLQDNGGPTFTHALLAGSLALNAGSNTLAVDPSNANAPLTSDQRTNPFVRIFGSAVDMGAFEVQPLLVVGDTATIAGTDGDDIFLYRVATRLAIVNGLAYFIPMDVNLVEFDGADGDDRFDLIGSPGDELALTRPKQVFFEYDASHTGFDVTGVDMETVILDGNGGSDTATLRDTIGAKDEKLFARPAINNALLFANDGSYFTSLFGFSVTTLFSAGNDFAKFFDSPSAEVAIVRPGNASLSSQGLLTNVQSFDSFLAQSLTGNDIANVFGTANVDFLTARNGFTVMSAGGQDLLFDSYATVNANGLQGDDLVRFNGNAGDDLLVATGTTASFTTGVSVINTVSFGRLIADARTGANDRAILTGTAGPDGFAGSPNFGELTGTGFFHRTNNFDRITINGLGGVNTLTDNGLNYVLIQQGTWV